MVMIKNDDECKDDDCDEYDYKMMKMMVIIIITDM